MPENRVTTTGTKAPKGEGLSLFECANLVERESEITDGIWESTGRGAEYEDARASDASEFSSGSSCGCMPVY